MRKLNKYDLSAKYEFKRGKNWEEEGKASSSSSME